MWSLSLVLLVIAACCAGARAQHFKVKVIQSDKDFSFPIFRHKSNVRAASRINKFLQLSEIMGLARSRSVDIFRQIKVNDGTIYGGKVGMMVTIQSNSSRVLSLGFDESSCGMTCTYWHRYYNFNPINGDRMELRDLFTIKGYERFSKMVLDRRSSKYRREVRKKVNPEYQEEYLGTIGCLRMTILRTFTSGIETWLLTGRTVS